MSLVLRPEARTHVGLRRANNEDCHHAGRRLLAVADGVGGAAAGEVASGAVVAALRDLDRDDPGLDLVGRLQGALVAGNQAIARLVREDPERRGMGTTLTAVLLGRGSFGVVNVGDSRTYLRREGAVRRLTRDDSYVQLLVDEGHITESEALRHPQRNVVLRALTGQDFVEPAIAVHDARPGDRLLLCSDGLTDLVEDDLLGEVLSAPGRDEAAERLVELALERGGKDNVTVVLADVEEAGAGPGRWRRG